MKFIALFLGFSTLAHAQTTHIPTPEELAQAKSISEKLYVSMARALPNQLGENDELISECSARDLYITCTVTDYQEEVGYTHGIEVSFDHYGREIAVDKIEYFEH